MKVPKISKKALIVGVVLIGIAGLIYWRRSGDAQEYIEYTVEQQNIRETLELSGDVAAGEMAVLRLGAGGLVTYMGAKEGDTVKKWQTIASLDTRLLKKTLEQKLNLYAIQRGTFDQTADDNDNSVPAGDAERELRRILEKNQFQLDNTVKDVEYQDLAIKLSRIYSPIEGILVSSPITVPNVQVAATDAWIIVNPGSLEFVADLDETDIGRISPGQSVEISLDAYPGEVITTTVAAVSYAPKETTTGTVYEVKMAIPPSFMSKLRMGLNGTAAVTLTEKENVAVVPSQAVEFRGGKTYLYVKEGEGYTEKEVDTGIESDGTIEIESGAGVGDHVYAKK